jgi:hypothetical protein
MCLLYRQTLIKSLLKHKGGFTELSTGLYNFSIFFLLFLGRKIHAPMWKKGADFGMKSRCEKLINPQRL